MEDCVFCKIAKGEIPTDFIYQDEEIAVFPDRDPAAPIHLLFIPKSHVGDISEMKDETVILIKNKILEKVEEMGLKEKGYRIVINGGKAMAIPHVHFHLLGDVDVARKVAGR